MFRPRLRWRPVSAGGARTFIFHRSESACLDCCLDQRSLRFFSLPCSVVESTTSRGTDKPTMRKQLRSSRMDGTRFLRRRAADLGLVTPEFMPVALTECFLVTALGIAFGS